MNFEEFSEQYLVERGMWPEEAKAIVATLVDSDEHYRERWFREDTRGYPVSMRAVVALRLHQAAVQWIDANKPMHFARNMFEPSDEFKALMAEKGSP